MEARRDPCLAFFLKRICLQPCFLVVSAYILSLDAIVGGNDMIRLGTSGFSYDDWIGPVYPVNLPRWQWLSYYASEFDTVELNVTYYRVPAWKTVAGWVEKTPQDFLFTVKAHRSLTHERKQPDYQAFIPPNSLEQNYHE